MRRIFIEGMTQHVIQRGNNRADIFKASADYELFCALLHDASLRFGMSIHGYVLMTNHFHLMVAPQRRSSVPGAMQAIGRRYVPYFNDQHQRTGGLFEGRYRSMLVDEERYWLTCLRYVELNPVRAGLVADPGRYLWSSYQSHALGVDSPILAEHPMFLGLGGTAAERQLCWRGICAEQLPNAQLEAIRGAMNTGRLLHPLVVPDGSNKDTPPNLSRVVHGV
jgi:putative transposase